MASNFWKARGKRGVSSTVTMVAIIAAVLVIAGIGMLAIGAGMDHLGDRLANHGCDHVGNPVLSQEA
jgi:hypothetical protein